MGGSLDYAYALFFCGKMWQDHDRFATHAAGHHRMFDSKVSSTLRSFTFISFSAGMPQAIPFYFNRTEICTPRWLRHLNLGMNPMESLDGLGNAFPRHGFFQPMANDSNELSIQSPSTENCRYRYCGASYTPEHT